jgi:hypothetical protein
MPASDREKMDPMGLMGRLLGRRTRRGGLPDQGRGRDGTGGRTAEQDTGTWAVDVSVSPELQPIPQPSPMTCWAAAGTMLKSWQARRSLSVDEVLDGLGNRWRAKFEAGEVLSATDLAAFARALGLVEQAPMEHSVRQLAEVLQDHGPVWVISDDGFEGNDTVHLRVVTAMKGDGTPEGTIVTLADSASGGFVAESFAELARDLQAADPVSFGAGIYHLWRAGGSGARDQAS